MSDGFTVKIEGYDELLHALKKFDGDVRKQLRADLKTAAQPVQRRAEALAYGNISRIGPKWSKMRIGVTGKAVYIVPKQKGTKVKRRKRGNLAPLLLHHALEPALEQSEMEIRASLEAMLKRVAAESGF